MTSPKRLSMAALLPRILAAVSSAALTVIATAGESAAAWPERPLKLVVGYTPGSAADVAGRIVAEGLGNVLGQRMIVENRPGAASNTAAESVARSEPDGYTLFLGNIANAINTTLKKGASVDINKDLKPVALVCSLPNILVVSKELPVRDVRELIALAKAKPNTLLFGSSGHGTSPHLSGELFKSMAGIDMAHVPYAGSTQPVQDMIGGRIHVMFAPSSTVLGQIEASTVRALAWTTLKRGSQLPELPTVSESGLEGFDTSIWFGLNGPAGLSDEVRDRIAAAVPGVLAAEAVLKSFRANGIEPLSAGPADYARFVAAETAKWGSVVTKAGLVQ